MYALGGQRATNSGAGEGRGTTACPVRSDGDGDIGRAGHGSGPQVHGEPVAQNLAPRRGRRLHRGHDLRAGRLQLLRQHPGAVGRVAVVRQRRLHLAPSCGLVVRGVPAVRGARPVGRAVAVTSRIRGGQVLAEKVTGRGRVTPMWPLYPSTPWAAVLWPCRACGTTVDRTRSLATRRTWDVGTSGTWSCRAQKLTSRTRRSPLPSCPGPRPGRPRPGGRRSSRPAAPIARCDTISMGSGSQGFHKATSASWSCSYRLRGQGARCVFLRGSCSECRPDTGWGRTALHGALVVRGRAEVGFSPFRPGWWLRRVPYSCR